MVKNMRSMMDRIRVQERIVMKHCVITAKMPKKDFIKAFAGNETSTAWLFKISTLITLCRRNERAPRRT